MTEMQHANSMDCDVLTAHRFQGHLLKILLQKSRTAESITVPNSKECIEALATASTHGAIFAITGGDRFTSDDLFKAAELPAKRAFIIELKKKKKKKKQRIMRVDREVVVKKILDQHKDINQLTGIELMTLDVA